MMGRNFKNWFSFYYYFTYQPAHRLWWCDRDL